MTKNRNEAQRVSRILAAVALTVLVPLAGCDVGDIGPIELNFDEQPQAFGDVQVNVSAEATHVGVCLAGGLLSFSCETGPGDTFSFLSGEEWEFAPATVPSLVGGSELTVHWNRLRGQATFSVVVPAAPEISSPEAGAVHHAADLITLRYADAGTDEITIENRGSCSGQYTYHWRRILPRDAATPGQLTIRAADLLHTPRAFDSCDVTLSVTAARPGTLAVGQGDLGGAITARATAEVSFQIVP